LRGFRLGLDSTGATPAAGSSPPVFGAFLGRPAGRLGGAAASPGAGTNASTLTPSASASASTIGQAGSCRPLSSFSITDALTSDSSASLA
jgi:hypothetical protein